MTYNLYLLVEMACRYLDEKPDLDTWRNGLIDDLNAAYAELCAQAAFLFLQATANVQMSAPVVGSSSAVVSITSGAYAVTLSGTTAVSAWEGQTFYGPDGMDYVIARIKADGTAFYLTTPYAGSTVASSTSWEVRFLAYPMPTDCEEVLSIVDATTKLPVPFVSRVTGEAAIFNPQQSGAPLLAVDTFMHTDRPPDYAPTLAVGSGGANALAASTTYEIGYTLNWCGRESPLSLTATADTTAGNKTITVSGMEDTRTPAGDLTGLYKHVYMRNKTRKGRWLRVTTGTGLDESTTTLTFDSDASVSRAETNELWPSEPFRQYLRMQPVAADTRIMRVQYQRKPRRLASDSDVPLIPAPFQQLIVYRALRRRAAMSGALATRAAWVSDAEDLERRFREQYLTRQDTNRQRQMMSVGGIPNALGPGIFWGATYTYTG